jgi:hypothetical protein
MTEGIEKVCCPKCGGKIFFDRDCYGWYEKCLYCGWYRDLPGIEEYNNEKHSGQHRPIEKEETVARPPGPGNAKPARKQ